MTLTALARIPSDDGLDKLRDRIVLTSQERVRADPECRKAMSELSDFFATNPSRTFHLRPACEAEIGCYAEWPDGGLERFVVTQRFECGTEYPWYVCLPTDPPPDLGDRLLSKPLSYAVPKHQLSLVRRLVAVRDSMEKPEPTRRRRGR